jgi:hypothetical protein
VTARVAIDAAMTAMQATLGQSAAGGAVTGIEMRS